MRRCSSRSTQSRSSDRGDPLNRAWVEPAVWLRCGLGAAVWVEPCGVGRTPECNASGLRSPDALHVCRSWSRVVEEADCAQRSAERTHYSVPRYGFGFVFGCSLRFAECFSFACVVTPRLGLLGAELLVA